VNIRFLKWSAMSVSFNIQYFTYKPAILLGVNPFNGPVGGGTKIKFKIEEYEGPRTRAGAGLPSVFGAFFFDNPIQIVFSASGSDMLVSNFYASNMSVSLLGEYMSRTYEFEVTLPASPTQNPVSSSIRILVADEELSFNQERAEMKFEYIGAKILSVVPASGYLNPGSEYTEVTLNVANLMKGVVPDVFFAGEKCKVTSPTADPIPNDLGTVTAIKVTVPELDYKYVGTVNISLSDSSLTEALMASFQYVLKAILGLL
jgi:hypothetical protein